jgi:monoamine oxidase
MTDSTSTTKKSQVLVVGAGFTGLTAARLLAASGKDVRVVEAATTHLGGRAHGYSKPTSTQPKNAYDHGAQYVGDLQSEIMALIRDLAPDALVNGAAMRKPYPEEIIVLGGRRYTHSVDDSLFGITGVPPTIAIWDVLGLLALYLEIVTIERQIDVVSPWLSPPELLALDQITVEDWLSRSWISPTARDLIRISVEALLSVETKEISPFYLLWYTACNNGFVYEINDNEGGAQQYWLSIGMSELAERYAAKGGLGGKIERGVEIASIDASGPSVVARAKNGQVYEAERVVVALSPHTAHKIAFVPELPAARKALSAAPMGRTIKCQVFYKSAWWRDTVGGSFGGWAGGAGFPIGWVMDNSPLDGSGGGVLMTFTVGAQADALGVSPTKAEVVKLVTETLAVLFDDLRALSTSSEFVDLVMFAWNAGSLVGGGPNTIMTPGMLSAPDGPARAMNQAWLGKVFFASSENALNVAPESKLPTWDPSVVERLPEYEGGVRKNQPPFHSAYSDMRQGLGYMDGAIVAGQWVAREVSKSLSGSVSAEQTSASATPSAPPVASSPAPSPPPPAPTLTAEQTLAILADVCVLVQGRSGVDLAGWVLQGWRPNPEQLQDWLQAGVVKILTLHGLVADPTSPEQALAGVQAFTGAGLRYTAPGASGDPTTLASLRQLARVASALMQARSAEPFVHDPPPSHPAPTDASAPAAAGTSPSGGAPAPKPVTRLGQALRGRHRRR